MATRLTRIDEKIEKLESRFNTEHELCETKIDAELKVTKADLKASLTAAQAIFDHTKLRTDEVIQSAERSRSRLTQAASVIGGFVTVIIAIFSFLGFNQLISINKLSNQIEDNVKIVEESKEKINEKKVEIEKSSQVVIETNKSINTKLAGIKRSINESEKYLSLNIILPSLYDAVRKHNEATAIDNYTTLKNLEPDDFPDYLERARINVVEEITRLKNKVPFDFTNLIEFIREDAENPEDKLLSYYVLMANAILANNYKFKSELPKFKRFIKDYQGEKLSKEDWVLSKFSNYFDSQKEEMRVSHDKIRD